jgi:beta-lactamase superfamily II metal-dependent hydrolase
MSDFMLQQPLPYVEFNFYGVGHGSCTHIVTPNGKHILVDIGSFDDWSVVEHLKNNEVSQIDCLIITHLHLDHIIPFPGIKYPKHIAPTCHC